MAGALVEHIEDQVLFPDVDVKQRLTLDKGYGIAEFYIARDSELRGQRIRDAHLGERDVLVLSILRGSVTIPNPKADTEILLGDQLLCYGKVLTLKSLIPKDRAGRRRRESKSKAPPPKGP